MPDGTDSWTDGHTPDDALRLPLGAAMQRNALQSILLGLDPVPAELMPMLLTQQSFYGRVPILVTAYKSRSTEYYATWQHNKSLYPSTIDEIQ